MKRFSITYETWDDESLEVSEADDIGFACRNEYLREAIRRVKKAIGRCKVENYGDEIILRPVGLHQVCFISFHSFGSCE